MLFMRTTLSLKKINTNIIKKNLQTSSSHEKIAALTQPPEYDKATTVVQAPSIHGAGQWDIQIMASTYAINTKINKQSILRNGRAFYSSQAEDHSLGDTDFKKRLNCVHT